MKLPAIVMLLLVGCCGCSAQDSTQNQTSNSQPTAQVGNRAAKPVEDSQAALNREAQEFLNASFAKAFTRCGDSVYTKWAGHLLQQYRDAQLSPLVPKPVSELDRMNGLEYEGWAKFTVGYWRAHAPKGWGDWYKQDPIESQVKKVKGRWVGYHFLFDNRDNYTAIKCSEIPEG